MPSDDTSPDTVADWVGLVHGAYPPDTAADWDSVGLQVGDPSWEVRRVLVTLDVTTAVVAEAASFPRTLVLAHHPTLFRPLARLTPDSAAGRVALAAARAEVPLLAAHTNLDVAADGTSDPVMRVLGIEDAAPLTSETRRADGVKLVTFVPREHTDGVLDAVADAGAGVIGDYEHCSFRVYGTGTFRPRPGTAPYTGEVGELNRVEEDRLEVVVPRSRLGSVVRALLRAHPYEEVAYDVHPLEDGAHLGFGGVGQLPAAATLADVVTRLQADLPAPHLRVAGDLSREVHRVAAVGGSGASLVGRALAAGADVLVTGDVDHHDALDALELGLALIDAGHHATEAAALPRWIERLRDLARREGRSAEVVPSAVPTDPWTPIGPSG